MLFVCFKQVVSWCLCVCVFPGVFFFVLFLQCFFWSEPPETARNVFTTLKEHHHVWGGLPPPMTELQSDLTKTRSTKGWGVPRSPPNKSVELLSAKMPWHSLFKGEYSFCLRLG